MSEHTLGTWQAVSSALVYNLFAFRPKIIYSQEIEVADSESDISLHGGGLIEHFTTFRKSLCRSDRCGYVHPITL